MRVLKWIIDRCEGRGGAGESPIGSIPRAEDLDLDGLEAVSPERMRELLAVKPEEWAKELKGQKEFFKTLEPYLPNDLLEELQKLGQRLSR
jgi:phosphoenolpyruvate carboxykinase (GTP)